MYKLSINQKDLADTNNDFFLSLCQFESIGNNEEFNEFCHRVINNRPQKATEQSDRFGDYMGKADIKTPWGGVYITKHEHPVVEKYLIINAGHYLAFEKHEKKEENIRVEEGIGILLKREGESIKIQQIKKGDSAEFKPGEEHCIIALENMIIFENSLDHKGMDQDLIFIFTPTV